MEFLNEEEEGALIAQKTRGEPMDATTYTPFAAALHVNFNNYDRDVRTDVKTNYFVCFARRRVTGPKNSGL